MDPSSAPKLLPSAALPAAAQPRLMPAAAPTGGLPSPLPLLPLLERTCRAIGWHCGEIWRPDPAQEYLYWEQGWMDDDNRATADFHYHSQSWHFAWGEGLPGRVWQNRASEWIEDLRAVDAVCYGRHALAKTAQLQAAFAVPLILNDELVAVLVFYNRVVTPPNPLILNLMETVMEFGLRLQDQQTAVAIQQREQRFTVLVENIPDYGICLLDAHGYIQSWNPGAETILGYPQSAVLQRHISDYLSPADPTAAAPETLLATAGRAGRYEGSNLRQHQNGTPFCAQEIITTLYNSQRQPIGFTYIVQDVTHQQEAMVALQRREAMYSSLFQQSNDGIFISDLAGNLLDANNRLLDWLGYSYPALRQSTVADLHPPTEQDRYCDMLRTLQQQRVVRWETALLRQDGTVMPVDISASLMVVDNRQLVQAIVRDMTTAKQSQDLMQQQLKRERLLANISAKMRQTLDVETVLQTSTQEVRQLLQTDRVLVYQFAEDWSGSVIVESVGEGWHSVLKQPIYDPCFGASYAERYGAGYTSAVDDIHMAGFKPCYVEFLEELQVRASLVVPIIYKDALWGLLVVHHCQGPRSWPDAAVESLKQLANQMAIAIHQAELYTKLQTELHRREHIEQELRASETSIRTLYDITSTPDLDFDERLQWLLRFGRNQFGLAGGQFCKIDMDAETCTVVMAQWGDHMTTSGAIYSLKQRFCNEVVRRGRPLFVPNASHKPDWANHPAHTAFHIETYLGTPVLVNGDIYGTLSFQDHRPHPQPFRPVDREFLQLMAQWIGVSLERQQASRILEEARDKALAATQAKGEFLATMSHEIRTPMNAIIGMTGLLLDTSLSDQQQDFAETIRSSSEALLTIINDILDFSKIESGQLELEQSDFCLRTCLEESLDLVVPQANAKSLELAYQIDPPTPDYVRGDVTRLRQILVNLLTNAVKFTHQGEVELRLQATPNPEHGAAGHQLHFSVRDTGIGIPPERMDRLFRPFCQVDASTTRKYGGTGLGLVICKQLTEAMGGTIWIDSVPGQGTTIHFTIAAAASSTVSTLDHHGLALRQRRVLVVDDNATNREILKAQTEGWGMEPMLVSSGAEALALLHQGTSVDIAVLDMQMPGMDGMKLAQAIHQRPETAKLPLVMLTSVMDAALPERATTTHFAAYLNKPVKHLQLFRILVEVLGGHRIAMNSTGGRSALDGQLAARHPLRVLLAEDNAVNQKLATHLLQRMGYRLEVAGNGLEVLQALERQTFDLVLMDVQMPEMDGIAASKAIHERYTPRPRIVALTANAMAGDREKYLAAGMDDYISKPIRLTELTRVIEETQPLATPISPIAPCLPGAISPSGPSSVPYLEGDARPPVAAAAPADPTIAVPAAVAPFATPNPAATPAIDEAVITAMVQTFGGDWPTVRSILTMYLDDAATLLDQLHTGATHHNLHQLETTSHILKSSSALVGAQVLSRQAATIEQHCRAGQMDPGQAQSLVSAMATEFERVRLALAVHLQGDAAIAPQTQADPSGPS